VRRDIYSGMTAPHHRFCELSELCRLCGSEMGNHAMDIDEDGHDYTPSGVWR
jgi:hypothetical protein